VTWNPVTTPAGVKIVNYQVIVNRGTAIEHVLLAQRHRHFIPGQFLEPDTRTGGEVPAREESGNQTITALPSFRTSS
jgi:hypothetical protein